MLDVLRDNSTIVFGIIFGLIFIWGIADQIAKVHQRIDRILEQLRKDGALKTHEDFHA